MSRRTRFATTASLIAIAITISLCCAQMVSPNDQATSACQTTAAATPRTSDPLVTPSLIYSITGLPCTGDATSAKYGSSNLLACSAVPGETYTRFVVDMPSRSNVSLVTTLIQNVTFVGLRNSRNGQTSGSYCLVNQADCVQTPCSSINPVIIKVASSPVRVAYSMDPAVLPTTPFGFLPVDLFGLNVSGNCAAAFASYASMTGLVGTFSTLTQQDIVPCSYNAGVITARYGDNFNTTTSCGIYSDPTTGLVGAQYCQVVCMVTYPGSNITSEHHRWLAGPTMGVYRVKSNLQWNSVLAMTVVTGSSQRTILVPSASSNTVMLSNDSLVRISVSNNYLTRLAKDARFFVDGYVFVANYDNPSAGNPINQGIFNPYLNISDLVQAAKDRAGSDPWALALASQVFFSRQGLNASQLGSGKVPTFRSTGQYSWFYVPYKLGQSRSSQYTQGQAGMFDRLISVAPNSPAQQCNAGNLQACWQGIPGWGVNATGGVEAPSICQMSSGVNAYAQQYLANLASGMNRTASVPPGALPLGLFPAYDISAPNVWINDAQILIDPGVSYDVTAVYSLAIDVSNVLLTYGDAPTGVVLANPDQGCIVNNQEGTGSLVISIQNVNPIGSGAISVALNASCSVMHGNVTGGAVSVYYNASSPNLIVPAQITVSSGVFQLTFVPNNNGTIACSVQATYPSLYSLPPLVWSNFTCADRAFPVPENSGHMGHVFDDWGTGTIVGICVAAGVALVIFISILIAICVKARK